MQFFEFYSKEDKHWDGFADLLLHNTGNLCVPEALSQTRIVITLCYVCNQELQLFCLKLE